MHNVDAPAPMPGSTPMASVPHSSTGPHWIGLDAMQAFAVLYATSIAVVMLNIEPAAEAYLRQDAQFSVMQVGAANFVELAMMGLATFPAYWWLGRIDSARVAKLAYVAYVAGNLLSSMLLSSFALYAAARALTGAAAGSLMILGMTAAARAGHPKRMFALVTLAQLASGAIILALMPALADGDRGLRGVFYFSALLGVAGLIWARPLASAGPAGAVAGPPQAATAAVGPTTLMQSIGFVAVFNIVIGGLWAFVAEYALGLGDDQAQIGRILTLATVAGLAGAALALITGPRWSPAAALRTGFTGLLLGAALLHAAATDDGFAVGCLLLSFSWNFSVPYVLATVAAKDRSGRSMSAANLAFAFGLAIGPLAAGWLIESMGLGALLPFAAAGLLLGALLMRGIV